MKIVSNVKEIIEKEKKNGMYLENKSLWWENVKIYQKNFDKIL